MFSTSLKNTFPGNGVRKNGPYLSWGGTLTGNTVIALDDNNASLTISGSSNNTIVYESFNGGLYFNDTTGGGVFFNNTGGGGFFFNDRAGSGIKLNSSGGGIRFTDSGTTNTQLQLLANATSSTGSSKITLTTEISGVTQFKLDLGGGVSGDTVFVDNFHGHGIIYNEDYSTTFIDRSLVDKGFVVDTIRGSIDEEIVDLGTVNSGTVTLDLSRRNFKITLDGSVTFDYTNLAPGREYSVQISRTSNSSITWSSGKWSAPLGIAPSLTTWTSGSGTVVDILTFKTWDSGGKPVLVITPDIVGL